MAETLEIDGLVQQRQELEKLLMTNPAMEKQVQKLLRKVLMTARRTISNEAKSAMQSDQRKAYKAVKTSVWKQILGGSVSILNRRGAARGRSSYEPPRKLREGQRGGNRVPRSSRTQQVMDYEGADRAFILRFVSLGTGPREAGTRNGRLHGNRGAIAPRNFFANSSQKAMTQAADQLATLIDELIKQELK